MDSSTGLPGADEPKPSQAGPPPPGDQPVYANADLLIQRSDLGEGIWTVIAVGSRIPPQLVRLPNKPYQPSVTLGRKRRRDP
ncbi:MAG: hypothetical protein ACRDRG_01575 [Pseudonocardiaceae bacterium]